MATRVIRLSSYSIYLDEADAKALYDMLIYLKEMINQGHYTLNTKQEEVLRELLVNLPESE
jgi:hypothetical protein